MEGVADQVYTIGLHGALSTTDVLVTGTDAVVTQTGLIIVNAGCGGSSKHMSCG